MVRIVTVIVVVNYKNRVSLVMCDYVCLSHEKAQSLEMDRAGVWSLMLKG